MTMPYHAFQSSLLTALIASRIIVTGVLIEGDERSKPKNDCLYLLPPTGSCLQAILVNSIKMTESYSVYFQYI
jgi:hypothetical protein